MNLLVDAKLVTVPGVITAYSPKPLAFYGEESFTGYQFLQLIELKIVET